MEFLFANAAAVFARAFSVSMVPDLSRMEGSEGVPEGKRSRKRTALRGDMIRARKRATPPEPKPESEHQQFYTRDDVVDDLARRALGALGGLELPRTCFDPSAGTNRFAKCVSEWQPGVACVSSDIAPPPGFWGEVGTRDALGHPYASDEAREWARPVIGGFNPPYGYCSAMALKFVDDMAPLCDYIAMLVPPVVILRLYRYFEKLLLVPCARKRALFTHAQSDDKFDYAVMFFVGKRREHPLDTDEAEQIALAPIARHFDVRRPGLVPGPHTGLVIRRVGSTAGRCVFFRTREGQWFRRQRDETTGPTPNFDGITLSSVTHEVVPRTDAAKSLANWDEIASQLVQARLPFLVRYSNHRYMRTNDVLGMLFEAVCAVPSARDALGLADCEPRMATDLSSDDE